MRMYISGDTLIHERLREIPRRFPDVDLALLHLGGTRVLGIMVTMDAEQGVEAMRIVDPRTAIPIHYNDYEAFTSPLEDFKRAVSEAGLEDRVHYLSHGDTYEFEVSAAHGRT
jgi:L-ascorbate metabolism protein UlaG (beta-lactamase superfamily)